MFTSASAHTMFECPSGPLTMERRWKSNLESAPNCPRCASSKTKFCYYNNYSLSQPRYFCKGCRRYWTKGGSLRNLPVGGGCRKSRRTKSCRQADRPGSQMPNPGSTGDESNNATNGADIDLAVVFANFLNQDNSINDVDKINVSTDQDSSSSGVSYTSQDLPLGSLDTENQLENMIFQCQKPTDIIERDQVQEGIPPLCIDAERIEELLDQNANVFELQAILGEDIGNDAVLSDGISLPNFEWQSFMNFQDFGSSFSTDDDLKIPSNLADDNWSSSDLCAGYEIFSNHGIEFNFKGPFYI